MRLFGLRSMLNGQQKKVLCWAALRLSTDVLEEAAGLLLEVLDGSLGELVLRRDLFGKGNRHIEKPSFPVSNH